MSTDTEDTLNNFKDSLEININYLSKFDGIESDLSEHHLKLKSIFSEYRQSIDKLANEDLQSIHNKNYEA
jgi:hypothetical protein